MAALVRARGVVFGVGGCVRVDHERVYSNAMTYNCLDLFSGLGGFSSAFEESDEWNVTTVDIQEEYEPNFVADIYRLRPKDLPEPDIILASPPCQYLSTAGNFDKWDTDAKIPISEESQFAVALFYHTIGLIQSLSPEYYYIENPRRSRIQWFIGPPDKWVTYCQYGMDYQKPTGLWGEFAPMTFKRCSAGDDCHARNTEDDGYSAVASMPNDISSRSKVPYELSDAIRESVEYAFENPQPKQTTISEVS